jgi:protein-tyrosine phosphatase
MIDIHSHLLPGVDDGSRTSEVSVEVLRRFAQDGVTLVVCTPHLNASAAASAPWPRHLEILDALRAQAPAVPALRLGWEIMLDMPGVDLTDPALTLGDSRALLVEFNRGGIPPGATGELRRIARSGRTPVLAHPERYFGCTLDLVREWRDAGVVIQTDAAVLLGKGVPSRMARAMLAEGLVDLLASDNHGDRRSLGAARDWLEAQGAGDRIALLTTENPRRVLADEDPLPVPPLPRSLVERVRGLFGR